MKYLFTIFFVMISVPFFAFADYNSQFARIEAHFRVPQGILAKVANIESGGNPKARAGGGSTASGMFQWLRDSWIDTSYAYNRATQPDPRNWKPLSLDDRFDVETSAKVTAFSLAQTKGRLGGLIEQAGMDMTAGLYMGHFLGIGGARQFMIAYIRNPNSIGASLFPKQARANPGIFRACSGYCTLAQIYNNFARKLNVAGTSIVVSGGRSDAEFAVHSLPPNAHFSNEQPFTSTDPERDFPQYSQSEVEDIESPSFPQMSLPESSQTSESAPNTSQPAGSSAKKEVVPAVAHLLAYPEKQRRNTNVVVYWSSVGMKNNGCSVKVGGDAFATGNVGEKRFAISSYDPSDVSFELRCTPPTGSVVVKTVSVQIE